MWQKKSTLKKVGEFASDHPIAILGSTVALGYAASRIMRSNRLPGADEFHITDADRALEFQPRGTHEPHDIIGDPSVRTSVGLETPSPENR